MAKPVAVSVTGTAMKAWRPIDSAPEDEMVLIIAEGWLPALAMRRGDHWGECLGGEYYGVKPPFKPTHWQRWERLLSSGELLDELDQQYNYEDKDG